MAGTHASNAGTSASAANTAKVAAETARDAAAGSASAASTSASTASTQASNAGTSASAANTSASTASTKAGEALAYRDSAAASESNALGYANAAAQDYTAVNARLNNAGGTGVTVEQKLTASASSITGLMGRIGIKIDLNGYVVGYGLMATENNGTPDSAFVVSAANFAVVSPGYAPQVMFSVSAGTVGFSGNLAGPSGTLGIITAATIQSGASGQRVVTTQKGIKIYDAANNLRAFFGDNS
jgi:hypothetical protein